MGEALRRLTSSGILKDVATLSFGTLAGRLITLASMPIITRIYSPDDFELLAVYMSIVSTAAVASCLRLDAAIPITKRDGDAAVLLVLSLMSSVFICIVMLIVVLCFDESVASFLGSPTIGPYLWLAPIGVLLLSSFSALQFWAVRFRYFGAVARTKLSQALAGTFVMLGAGWLGFSPIGLLLGNVLTVGAGSVALALRAWRVDGILFSDFRWSSLYAVFKRHSAYPKYSILESLSNVGGTQVPMLIIAGSLEREAGFLFLAFQIMMLPMTLIGASMSQVYVSRGRERILTGGLGVFTYKFVLKLMLIGLPLILIVGMGVYFFSETIFGAEWGRSGELVLWLMPWMVVQFLASPISMALHMIGEQRNAMHLQVLGFVIRVGIVFILAVHGRYVVEGYCIVSTIFYLVYFVYVSCRVRAVSRRS